MTSLATSAGTGLALPTRGLFASRWLWCLAAVLVIVLLVLRSTLATLDTNLGDTDDATRLLQVRALLDGAGWYDMSLTQLGGSVPLVSHWSRLIDAPLAALLVLFGLIMPTAEAELAVRLLWPSLVLLVFLRLLVHEAEVREGPLAGVLVLVFAAGCMTGLYQFRPGRLDHHNVMILGTIAGLLWLARGLDAPRLALLGGMALGLTLAIGYEPLTLIVPLLGVLVLAAGWHAPWLHAARQALAGLSATLVVTFLASTPPDRWLVATCDALSLNAVVAACVAVAGVALLYRRAGAMSRALRLTVLAGTAIVALAAALAIEPACARGPFGQMNPEAVRLWLVHVHEGRSLWAMYGPSPLWVWALAGLLAAGAWSAWSRWRVRRTVESAAVLVIMLAAVPPSVLMMKFNPYGSWLAVICIAMRVASLPGRHNISQPLARTAGVVLLNQYSMAALAAMVLVPDVDTATAHATENIACERTPVVRSLSSLPPGLVVSPIDIGPYIAALTPHSVLSGPYHRLDRQIVDTFAIFHGNLRDAEAHLRRLQARYLVHCPRGMLYGRKEPPVDSLLAMLESGQAPAFLERLPIAAGPLTVYALRPAAAR